MAKRDDIRVRLLELLATGPASLRPLFSEFARWQVYGALKELRREMLVMPGSRSGTWQLTQAGVQAAEGAPVPPAGPPAGPPVNWPTLPGVPHLDVLPSREHQALGRLVLLAATARRHYEHHHASFVMFSRSGLRGKTWLGRWASLVLGGGDVVHAVAEGGRSLAARRRGDGQVAAVRAALGRPMLMIDEWRRGSTEVRRLTTVLIHGDRYVPFEDARLDVQAVVLLALNSPAGADGVEEATGLDAPMIRRCLVACLERVILDASFARDGEERLDRVRELGPVALPDVRPGAVDERSLRDRIADALEVVLDSRERMGSLDLVLLGQLAVAACAWGLSVEEAVAMVVHSCCVLWCTTRWTAAGWEERLAEVVGCDEEVQEAETLDVVMEEDVEGDHAWEDRVAELDRVARAHGAGDPTVLDEALGLAAAVRGVGLGAKDLVGLRELLRVVRGPRGDAEGRLRVLAIMDKCGVAPEEAKRVLEVAAAGKTAFGLGAEDVMQMLRGIQEAGLASHEVGAWAAWSTAELGRLDGEVELARAELRRWRREVREAATDLATCNARIAKLGELIGRARSEPGLARLLAQADSDRGREIVQALSEVAGSVGAPQTSTDR
ncbi:MAG: hypothetical protein KF878_17445 [Planctomycetes bacterium]|nr:hypothetical protein [Planctomycetota bacterium]